MTIWGPILLYLLAVLWSGIVVMPLFRLVFEDIRRVPLVSVSLSAGFALVLTAFTLLARLNSNYEVTIPLLIIGASILSTLLWYFTTDRSFNHHILSWDLRADGVILGASSLLLLVSISIRSNWPSIFWDNILNRNGSEKLFNLSLIQSFIFGQSFPPENLWNLGEQIDYYILLHTLPGLTAWGWRVLTGDPSAGGVLFVFSDAFLLVWGSVALMSWGYSLLGQFSPKLTRRQALIIALSLGIGVFLSVHASAIVRVFQALFFGVSFGGWSSLQDYVIAWTKASYPFWTLLMGDNHAFIRIHFLQISFISSFLLLLSAERFHPARIFLTAVLAAAVLLAHPGSVMLDALIGGPAAIAMITVLSLQKLWTKLANVITNLLGTTLLAGALSLPRILETQPPITNWYWVETSLASPLAGFISLQCAPLLFFALAASTAWINSSNRRRRTGWFSAAFALIALSFFGYQANSLISLGLIIWTGALLWPDNPQAVATRHCSRWPIIGRGLALVAILALVILGRPAAALALICASLILVTTPRTTPQSLSLMALGSCLFLIWIMPEFLVVESPLVRDAAGLGKRFNITMRFWLEGYYLIPFTAVLLWSPLYPEIFSRSNARRSYATISIIIATLWIITHGWAVADRIRTVDDEPGMNGAAVLSRLAPHDAAIVTYLQKLPNSIHIGELCGTGEIISGLPAHFDWPGRIAAFSARPGLCGWTNHVWQFGTRLRNPSPTGSWSWVRFREYERHLQAVYTAAISGSHMPESLTFFGSLGITHLIVGEGEQRFFPLLNTLGLAKAIGGTVVFEGEKGTGVVALKGIE
jgi:hypothetical protein